MKQEHKYNGFSLIQEFFAELKACMKKYKGKHKDLIKFEFRE